MNLTGQTVVFRLFYPAGRKNQMTQLTGNFFCPQRGVRRQHLIVIRIPLDISLSHCVEGIRQTGQVIEYLPDLLGKMFSLQSHSSIRFFIVLNLSGQLHGTVSGNAGKI